MKRLALLLITERSGDLIAKRLGQVGDHPPIISLDEGFDRHPRHQLKLVESRNLLTTNNNINGIVALSRALIHRNVGGNPRRYR